MVDTGCEQGEELTPVNDGPQPNTETTETKYEKENVVAVETELDT